MSGDRRLTFYHAPRSRSAGARMLVEELQADVDLQVLDLQAGQNRAPHYLAINPMGKVPALVHHGALVIEQPAVYMYLAELYPERGLSPAVGDPLRAAYLRWMVFYGSCFEPAVVDRSMKRDPAPLATSPYGTYDAVIGVVQQQLSPGPWWLGGRFTAVDVLWGSALNWMTAFKLMPESPELTAYLARFNARPAIQRAKAADEALAAQLDAQRA